jgi:hypothetical protein
MRSLAATATALVLALVAPAAAQPAAKPVPPPPSFQIKGIHAFLYFHRTGGFGDRDLTTARPRCGHDHRRGRRRHAGHVDAGQGRDRRPELASAPAR